MPSPLSCSDTIMSVASLSQDKNWHRNVDRTDQEFSLQRAPRAGGLWARFQSFQNCQLVHSHGGYRSKSAFIVEARWCSVEVVTHPLMCGKRSLASVIGALRKWHGWSLSGGDALVPCSHCSGRDRSVLTSDIRDPSPNRIEMFY
jgi:hypothetical protein